MYELCVQCVLICRMHVNSSSFRFIILTLSRSFDFVSFLSVICFSLKSTITTLEARFPSSNGMHTWNGTKRREKSCPASKIAAKQPSKYCVAAARWNQRVEKSAIKDSPSLSVALCESCVCMMMMMIFCYSSFFKPFLWAIGNGIPSLISKNVSFNTGNNN